jgi:hypothetical protein
MPKLNDKLQQVKYITHSIIPSSRVDRAFYDSLSYIWITPNKLARFDNQRGNLNRQEYIDKLMDFAETGGSWFRSDKLFSELDY